MEANHRIAATAAITKKNPLTPRQLIWYHIENPEEPITDDDIRNLKLDHQEAESIMERNFNLPEE